MGTLESILTSADARTVETLARLERWVGTNSHTGTPDNVNAMGALLKEAFTLPGLELRTRASESYGEHLAWQTPAWDDSPEHRLLLLGHHDTVFPPGSFEGWVEQGELVRGPGVLDMKGGIASVWCALASIAEAGLLAAIPLAFVSVADEEVGSPDSRSFTRDFATGARAALVFEAGRAGDAIITARKGTGAVRVSATGRSAHAGNFHQDGVNAIWALARFVDGAERLTDYERGVTVNVGTIRGGTSKNTVPEHAELELDFRVISPEDAPRLMKELGSLADSIGRESRARIELEGGVRRPPLVRSEASVELYRRYAVHASAAGLGSGESPLLGGGSDANDVGSLGVPVIDGLGPRGRGFHTNDEHIEVATLPQRTAALIRFLTTWEK